jgi:hypothetical protein
VVRWRRSSAAFLQLEKDNVELVEVDVAGHVARRDPELIGRAVLKGLLDGVTVQAVNLVNARLVAAERGLEVVIRTDETPPSGYSNLVTVTTQAGAGRKIIAGTVFDGAPRIVRLRDLHIEFIPEGHDLVLSYEDRPGMVGKIGSILGRHNVNIASMHVGRRTKRGRAIVVLLLDEDVPPEVMEEVSKAVEADFARVIRLDARSVEAGGPAASRASRARAALRGVRGGRPETEEGGLQVKRLVVQPGHRISLQRHRFRPSTGDRGGDYRIVISAGGGSPCAKSTPAAPDRKPRRAVVIIEVQHGPRVVSDIIAVTTTTAAQGADKGHLLLGARPLARERLPSRERPRARLRSWTLRRPAPFGGSEGSALLALDRGTRRRPR